MCNVRSLWKKTGLTGAELSDRIGAGENPEWFRAMVSSGLSRVIKRNKERLNRLAQEFGVSLDDLWREDLLTSIPATKIHLDARLAELEQTAGELLPRIERVKLLLESGRYGFLGEMIDTLYEQHRAWVAEERRRSENKAEEDEIVAYRRRL